MKRIFTGTAIALIAALSLGCTQIKDEAEHAETASSAFYVQVKLTCVDASGALVETERRIPYEDDFALAALHLLLDQRSNRAALAESGLSCPLPKSTNISLSIRDGEACADLSGLGILAGEKEERAAVACVVNTLLAFSSVDSVKLTFDGEHVLALKHGTPVGEPFFEPLTQSNDTQGETRTNEAAIGNQ